MLNTFPYLLTYGLVAPFILRVVLGGIFLYFGYVKITRMGQTAHILSYLNIPNPAIMARALGFIQAIAGLALIAGFLTQIAAIIILVISLSGLYIKIKHSKLIDRGVSFYLLAIIIALSLIFTGAGFWAFDMPL